MNDSDKPGRSSASMPLEPQLATFLTTLGEAVNQAVGDAASVETLRMAARAARLDWSLGGQSMPAEPVEGLGMPARLYRPSEDAPLPAMVYFHGGGWTLLDLDTHDRLMRAYARRSGWAMIGLDYPLAPEVRFPDSLGLCVEAVANIRGAAEDLGLSPELIVLGGDSSGANLALAAAMIGARQGCSSPLGLMLNYGVFDCDLNRPSYRAFSDPPYLLSAGRMAYFWDNYCPESAARADPLASPLRASTAMLAPLPRVHLTIAAQDVLVDENKDMARRLECAGVTVTSLVYAEAAHGFLEAVDHSPVADRAVGEGAMWLRELARQSRRPPARHGD